MIKKKEKKKKRKKRKYTDSTVTDFKVSKEGEDWNPYSEENLFDFCYIKYLWLNNKSNKKKQNLGETIL